ncbi:putative E3 ubiquitin-protein ligase LIN-2 isoform X3 [Magnolia sinica]|uniref:putative E3 ubiquitin-protein ligase LIN-2 isoform X3 n=1 Tax=Magnolia sinica TaxID=86752 RepID=UPI0026595AE2|nr:putative E3 ubiquitin-protein ligase LIN-2 isoform X3 [Magnolia sinica]
MESLEELLAEEGFKGGKMKWRSRNSFKSDTTTMQKVVSMPQHLHHEQNHLVSAPPDIPVRTRRVRSDVSWHVSGLELQKNEGVRDRRSSNNMLEIERLVVKPDKDAQEIEIVEETDSTAMREYEKFSFGDSDKLQENLRYEVGKKNGSKETRIFNDQNLAGVKENASSKERFSKEFLENDRLSDGYGNDFHENERNEVSGRGLLEDGRYGNRSSKPLLEKMNLNNASRNSSQSSKNSGDLQSQRCLSLDQIVSEPALDEAAVQAMISILSNYVRRFPKDQTFRTSLRQNCLSCLSSTGLDEPHHNDSGAIVNFGHAVETVERVADKSGNPMELKKASLQLSVIAGLNSKGLKDGFTSGISNSHLAACAHLYLSVIYKLRKKDLISAKHLLQVFCDSPFQARKSLLPELWGQLFLPHLSHLRLWFNQEAEAILNSSSRPRKMKHLEKAYNEIVDSGTYQFAVYYKEWLTKGIGAPTIPSILTPTTSVRGASAGDSHGLPPELQPSKVGYASFQPMTSKRLREAVDVPYNKYGADEVKDGEAEESFSTCLKSLDGASEEFEGAGSCYTEPGTNTEQHMQQEHCKDTAEDASIQDLAPENASGSHYVAVQDVKELQEESSNALNASGSHCVAVQDVNELQEESRNVLNITGTATILHLISHTKANELTLKKLAKAVFHLQHTEDSPDSVSATMLHSKCMPVPYLYTNQSNKRSCMECKHEKIASTSETLNIDLPVTSSSAGLHGNYEYFEETSFFSSIPKDFFCPLTRRLFEDPITLETGQTYERLAIKEWFNRGSRTCPVTGQTLGSVAVPSTNFVLKRVIDGWKSEHCRNLLVFATHIAGVSTKHNCRSKETAAMFILEQLLTSLNTEESMENAKLLISLGGLQFLVRRLELGNMEEKTCTATLLSCCIKADGSCRNYLVRNIDISCLIQLLHNKQVNSRTNVVLLLTELICLNRRTAITLLLRGMRKEGITNTLHVLLVYIQSCPPEQRPLVAVLLLHLDFMIEPIRHDSIYAEAAVNALIVALDCSLTDEKVQEQSCKALLILGGHFSYSGERLTETWLLNQAGFYDGYDANSPENPPQEDGTMPSEEEKESELWAKNIAASLLHNGKMSFLETISKCLDSKSPDLVSVCLTMVAWISHALFALSNAELQLSVFSSLIPPLKESLKNAQIEHRVLASMSLLNFSKVSDHLSCDHLQNARSYS